MSKFKKRIGKKEVHIRRKKVEEETGVEDEGVEAAVDLGLFKMQQSMRKRGNGIDINARPIKAAKADGVGGDGGGAALVEDGVAGKFEVKEDIGLVTKPSEHEDIMEAYIRSKMARDEPATVGQADIDDDDDGAVAVAAGSLSVYAISEDVKALAKGDFELAANAVPSSRPRSGSDADTTPAGQGATVSALLAEVALPDKYRHNNEKATEEASHKQRRRHIPSSTAGMFRFGELGGKKKSAQTKFDEEQQKVSVPAVATVSVPGTADAHQGAKKKQFNRASDNIAFERFKKREMAFKR